MAGIRVIQWGLGAMGSGMARLLAQKSGLHLVAAFDSDPNKIGRDVGEYLGGAKTGIIVQPPLPHGKAWVIKGDIMLLAADSFTRGAFLPIKMAIEQGINVITIAEEMAFPWANEPGLALQIDKLAKKHGITVLGTGINPGFVLDTLILALTGPCLEVNKIKATRINDLASFGPTVMRTQGVGKSVAEFEQGLRTGEIVGHIGFPESMHMMARALGWELEKIEEVREPIMAKVYRETAYAKVQPGQVAGCRHLAIGYVKGEPRIELIHPQQVLPQLEGVETGDFIEISGQPNITVRIKPEIPGGLGTMALAVNMIPQVLAARPGLLSMAELPVPVALMGDVRELFAWRQGKKGHE